MALNRYHPYNVPAQIRQPNWNDLQYAGNMGGHVADYVMGRGDFANLPPSKKSRGENPEIMEADSTNDENNNNTVNITGNSMGMSLGGSNTGRPGRFLGNTSTKPGFEKHYFERDVFNSRKIMTRDLLWGFSSFPIKDVNGNHISLSKWTNCYGVVYRPEITGNVPKEINIFQAFNKTATSELYVSLSDHCYSHAINFSVGDFYDKKLLSEKGGALRNFVKVRLLKIAVKIDIITRKTSAFDLNNGLFHPAERFSVASPTFSAHSNYNVEATEPRHHKYWIYRDINGDYLNQATMNIPNIPPDAEVSKPEDTLPRTCHQIRAYDNNLCVASDNEPFYFEREIKPQGTYYITPDQLWSMRQSNIAVLINHIEHQYGSSAIVESLPEYYSLLIVPTNVDWYESHLIRLGGTDQAPIKGHLVLAQMATQLAITCTATWQGFNYNHKGELQKPTLFSTQTEPLRLAEANYLASQSVSKNQINKGL